MSLVEVMLAVALVAIAGLALLGLNLSGIAQLSQGRTQVAALDAAERSLESVKELGYDAIPTGAKGVPTVFDGRRNPPDSATGQFPPPPYPRLTLSGNDYQLVVTTRLVDDHLKHVLVQVCYGERQVVLGRNFSN